MYVLTSRGTFSAAEEFTYNLKHMERATIVGDTTGGGAHPVDFFPLDDGFFATVSIGRAINPITKTNWEGVGVIPHIAVPQEQALEAARMEAMKTILADGVDAEREQVLTWHIAGLKAELHPITLSDTQMAPCVGTYGPRTITLEEGALFYQREGRPKFLMIPMAEDVFRFEGLEFFRLRFVRETDGVATAIVGMYDNGRTDRHTRNAIN